MELCVFTEPQQGASYDSQLAIARATEEAGYRGFFRSDHLLAMGSGDGLPGPTDAWVTLAGLARETSTIRLGTLVTAATFRHPGVLAVTIAQVDAMSGGRVDAGLGTGWFEAEHAAYGLPFPPLRERFDRLEEQLAVLTGLWRTPPGATFSFDGAHYSFVDSPALPKPVQPRVPLIVGGGGHRRTPQLAARYATEFNLPFASVEDTAAQFERVRQACRDAGRDPGELTCSAALVVCVGADEAEVARRAAAIGREPDELRANGVAGTPREAAEVLERYAAIGCGRVYLQFLDLTDLDHVRFVAQEVASQVA